jgi:Heavy metal associated domain 2
MDKPDVRATLASVSPGRIRVRLHRASRHPRVVHRLQERMQDRGGVTQVDVNASTGSVVVHYDKHALTFDDILALLRDSGVVIGALYEEPDIEAIFRGRAPASEHVVDAVGDLDRRLLRLTGHKLDLRLLFPASLFALGLRQALVQGLGLADIPAFVLLWYAFDSFWKMNHESPRKTPAMAQAAEGSSPAGTTDESRTGTTEPESTRG